jgi:hypothetical protein|tara:strand:+ start:154 stop:309 length:156 start_codon:yes stop_codon:yes gene_type:complete
MKKIIRIIAFLMAGLMSWFNPVQAGMCCVSCAMKKEDEVEIIEEFDEDFAI